MDDFTINVSFSDEEPFSSAMMPIIVEFLNANLMISDAIYIKYEALGLIKYESIQAMKNINPEVHFTEENLDYQFGLRKCKLNIIDEEGEVKQVTFINVKIRVTNSVSVIVKDNKYLYINTVDGFSGVLSKDEESKEIEPFLKEMIEDNQMSEVFSAYPPGTMADYSALFELEDMQEVTFIDGLFINNVDDEAIKKELINERGEINLRDFEPWDILPKPGQGQIIPKETKVKLVVGTGMVLKELKTLFEIISTDYSILNIYALDCFYYIDKERAESLGNFLKYNINLNNLNLKVADEEDIVQLFEVLSKCSVLNIDIEYHGEVTPSMDEASRKFIVSCIDKKVNIICISTNTTLTRQI